MTTFGSNQNNRARARVHGLLIRCQITQLTSFKVLYCAWNRIISKNYKSSLGNSALIPKKESTTQRWSSQTMQVFLSSGVWCDGQVFDAPGSFRLSTQPKTVPSQPWGWGVLRLPSAGRAGTPGSHHPICGAQRGSSSQRPPRWRPTAGGQQLLC